jgi:hypothetical protein
MFTDSSGGARTFYARFSENASFRSPFEPVGYGEYKSLDSTKEHPLENLTRFHAFQDRILAVGRLGVFWNG